MTWENVTRAEQTQQFRRPDADGGQNDRDWTRLTANRPEEGGWGHRPGWGGEPGERREAHGPGEGHERGGPERREGGGPDERREGGAHSASGTLTGDPHGVAKNAKGQTVAQFTTQGPANATNYKVNDLQTRGPGGQDQVDTRQNIGNGVTVNKEETDRAGRSIVDMKDGVTRVNGQVVTADNANINLGGGAELIKRGNTDTIISADGTKITDTYTDGRYDVAESVTNTNNIVRGKSQMGDAMLGNQTAYLDEKYMVGRG
jgi:hypothetical protein